MIATSVAIQFNMKRIETDKFFCNTGAATNLYSSSPT
jgi:hypothetical protein